MTREEIDAVSRENCKKTKTLYDLPLADEEEVKAFCIWKDTLPIYGLGKPEDWYFVQIADRVFILNKQNLRYLHTTKFVLLKYWKKIVDDLEAP